MTRQKLTIGFVAAAFAVSVAPVWAAQSKEQAGSRPNTGQTTGSAEPRGGGGGGGNAGGGGGSSTVGSGGSSGGSASSGFGSSGSTSGYAPVRERAPERPSASGERRAGGGDRAVMRGGAGASGNTRGNGGTGTTSSIYGEDRAGERSRAPVPAYSRPREGRPVTGGVAERPAHVPGRGDGYYPIYDPYYYYGYYDPYWFGYSYRYSSYWMPGYGYGFGYFGYDPFLFGGYYDPYAYAYGQAASGGYGTGRYHGAGALRLKVRPANAQVYIDGYYVGVVDSFDGMFQRLDLDAGSHRVEVRAEGYETATFDVMLTPGETVTYKGELKRIH
jgi:hypothetical protein